MFLKVSQMKASTLCAGSALLVLGGFMSVNLAGCGGGGGGGGGLVRATATPVAQTVRFQLQRQDGSPSSGGTISLTGPATLSGTADANGNVSLPSLAPGVYTVTFRTVDASGAASAPTTTTITVTRASGQNFLLLQGQSSGTGAFSVTGTVRLNPDDGDTTTAGCASSSTPVTGPVLVSIIDLSNTNVGQPIIGQVRREQQSSGTNSELRGRYTVLLPFKPRVFRVQVSQFDASGARYAGLSATTNFAGNSSVTRVDVCVNDDGTIPGPVVTPSAAPTGTFTFPTTFPTGTSVATATARPTNTPQPTATTQPTTAATVVSTTSPTGG